jgi:hypothetical protein
MNRLDTTTSKCSAGKPSESDAPTQRLFDESLALRRAIGDRRGTGGVLAVLGRSTGGR